MFFVSSWMLVPFKALGYFGVQKYVSVTCGTLRNDPAMASTRVDAVIRRDGRLRVSRERRCRRRRRRSFVRARSRAITADRRITASSTRRSGALARSGRGSSRRTRRGSALPTLTSILRPLSPWDKERAREGQERQEMLRLASTPRCEFVLVLVVLLAAAITARLTHISHSVLIAR
ncbi:hypothetical protein X777_07579 [Ooceraea biroi]|uniref:Uncharacterized protein n=1 Tax=Ooceraea biroi TaxID=2015173 RepID=A0A026X3U8_OOCBI|nr:hypothetical protein X777_07579 [Ooceraea biroi]